MDRRRRVATRAHRTRHTRGQKTKDERATEGTRHMISGETTPATRERRPTNGDVATQTEEAPPPPGRAAASLRPPSAVAPPRPAPFPPPGRGGGRKEAAPAAPQQATPPAPQVKRMAFHFRFFFLSTNLFDGGNICLFFLVSGGSEARGETKKLGKTR